MKSQLTDERPASAALTRTGGFLDGFTHTLQPYIGCQFGCEYCYVKGLSVHRFHRPALAWGAYAHPRTGIEDKLRRELARHERQGTLNSLAIFMSSATDPYQGLERRWRLTRACLDVFGEYPPGLLVIQTRSPLVEDDFARIRRLGSRCWLNMTIETDLEPVRRLVTPTCPAIPRRFATARAAMEAGLNVQITVSPCLPYSDVETFGRRLSENAHRVIVDSFTSGDGRAGKRTAQTRIPEQYREQGWGDWQAEGQALALYNWLFERMGERAGWSREGFVALTKFDRRELEDQVEAEGKECR